MRASSDLSTIIINTINLFKLEMISPLLNQMELIVS